MSVTVGLMREWESERTRNGDTSYAFIFPRYRHRRAQHPPGQPPPRFDSVQLCVFSSWPPKFESINDTLTTHHALDVRPRPRPQAIRCRPRRTIACVLDHQRGAASQEPLGRQEAFPLDWRRCRESLEGCSRERASIPGGKIVEPGMSGTPHCEEIERQSCGVLPSNQCPEGGTPSLGLRSPRRTRLHGRRG